MHNNEQIQQNQKQVYGEILRDGFFLRQHVGEATSPDGKKFELATTMKNNPMILYGNKAYILTWNDICYMASEAGLFEED